MGPDVLQPSGQHRLAQARERFLTAGGLAARELASDPRQRLAVRDTIRASWTRSRAYDVRADRLELSYVRDPDLDTPLARGADRVLQHLRDQLDGQPLALVLTDASGLVLSRLTTASGLERHLDRVRLAPGFTYAESAAGTNGIGTTLEAGRATYVVGHEHYAEHLEDLACAAAPIRDPLSGKTIGVIDLTCWRKDAGTLLVTLARTTAEQIRQSLLNDTGQHELDLLHAYLRACRRTAGIVMAVSDDVVMENELAQATLSPDDRAALVRHGAHSLSGRPVSMTVELPSGTTVRLHARRVDNDSPAAGGVIDARIVAAATAAPAESPPPGMLLPGLVGDGTLWQRACREALAARRSGEWLAVSGEAGSGRGALLRGVHQRLHAAERFTVIDGNQAGDSGWRSESLRVLLEHDGAIVLRGLERLDAPALRALVDTVGVASNRPGVWLGLVLDADAGAGLDELLRLLPSTVEVPPLRHHVEDVALLVPFLLRRLGRGGQLTCSAEAMQVLQRAAWPGNVAQLLRVLSQVVQHRRSGEIAAGDLPAELRSVSRRRLSPLESLERDAIVSSLRDAGGDKAEAARALGISRATIYRRIHGYGIVVPV